MQRIGESLHFLLKRFVLSEEHFKSRSATMKAWWDCQTRLCKEAKCPVPQENITGTNHSSVTAAADYTSPMHVDTKNTHYFWGGHADYHISMTNHPEIGFLFYMNVDMNVVQPILVPQHKNVVSYFYCQFF